ncbi:MAG: DUF4405 domain-containing protein [Candidatus Aminicenantes bacterium]|nr:DUF4405 domain-containing protein [Candidatus Aminicenantes bacterium]
MRLRDKINLIVDLLLTLSLALIAGIGLLIKYTLPPGRERILKFGDNLDMVFLGLDRHQWGKIHLAVGYVMLGFLVLHIVLHWKTLLCLVRKAVPSTGRRRVLWSVTGILSFLLLLSAFIVSPARLETGDFLHRNLRSRIEDSRGAADRRGTLVQEDEAAVHAERREAEGNHAKGRTGTGGGFSSLGQQSAGRRGHLRGEEDHGLLNGRMTLGEAAVRFGITIAEAKRRLELPADTAAGETLGRLRRAYGFTMQEVRERLEKER